MLKRKRVSHVLKKVCSYILVFVLMGVPLQLSNLHATISDHVVISEVYGGGGNAGALYTHDFIELYNPTNQDIDISGWQLKYYSQGTTVPNDNNVFTLPETAVIKANGYYLTQHSKGSGGTEALPQPDAVGNIGMGAKGCIVDLYNKQGERVDLVGVDGAIAEGTKTPAISNTTSAQRKDNEGNPTGITNGWDTNNNATDFFIDLPTPRNSAYNANPSSVLPAETSIETVKESPTEILLGTSIVLTSPTLGSHLFYQLNGGNEIEVTSNTVTLSVDAFDQNHEWTIVVYAKLDGVSSETKTYTYKQVSTSFATAMPGSGRVDAGTSVSLTASEGELIVYQIVERAGTATRFIGESVAYATPIVLDETMFPVELKVTTSKLNYLSTTKTFTYALKQQNTSFEPYFGQLHAHTSDSDGTGTPEQAFDYAKNTAGVDFLALTEHSNYFESANTSTTTNTTAPKWLNGQNLANEKTVDGQFVAIYGYEMTWSGGPGHINSFNTDGFVSRQSSYFNNKVNDAGLKAYYDWLVQSQPNSISQFNHPGKTFGTFADYDYWTPESDARINLFEVGNGEGLVGSGGYFPSYNEYYKALDKGWHLAPTNGQDNHKGKWGNANTTRTVVLAASLTRNDLYEAMSERRVYATEDDSLEINYTLNGAIMGSILDEKPATIHVEAKIMDPDTTDQIKSVSLVTSGGKELATQTFTSREVTYTVDLNNDYPYYFLKVVQADGDIAITAPIWTSSVEKTGISYFESSEEVVVTDQPILIQTEIYNDETTPFEIQSIKITKQGETLFEQTSGQVVKGTPLKIDVPFTATTAHYGTFELVVEGSLNGQSRSFTKQLNILFEDKNQYSIIAVDGVHLNEYVTGNYADSMGNFSKLALEYGARVVILKDELSIETLAGASMLILTPPSRKNASPLSLQSYSDQEIEAIKTFVSNGGSLIVTGLADYGDFRANSLYHSAYQQNRVLEAIQSSARIVDDQVIDNTTNSGQNYRLKFTNYQMDSTYLKDVVAAQEYSFYSGSHVQINDPSKVTPLVLTHPTTLSSDADNDGLGGPSNPITGGTQPVLTVETLENGAKVFVGGSVFMSNFEVQATLDNYGDLPYSNHTISKNIVESISQDIQISTIEEVWAGNPNEVFTIEGFTTSNASGFDKETAFFDSIYIQDQTRGINLFPVAGNIEAGTKLRVKGYVSAYNGERQLNVTSFKILDEPNTKQTPSIVSPTEAMLPIHTGSLLQVSGQVSDLVYDDGGVLESFLIDHSTHVFIDGYITKTYDLSNVKEGAMVDVIGLASVSTEGPRLRIRNRAEITVDLFLEQAKVQALEEIDGYRKTLLNPILESNYLDDETKRLFESQLMTIMNQANIDTKNCRNEDSLTTLINDLKSSMDQVYNEAMAQIKTQVSNQLDALKEDVLSNLGGYPLLSQEQKDAYMMQINNRIDEAKTSIDQSTNLPALIEESKQSLNQILIEASSKVKELAKQAVLEQENTVIDLIKSLPFISNEQMNALLSQWQQHVQPLLDQMDRTIDLNEVVQLMASIETIKQSFQPNILSVLKDGAITVIQSQAQQLKDQLNQTNLTPSQKEETIKWITYMVDQSITNIENCTSTTDIETTVNHIIDILKYTLDAPTLSVPVFVELKLNEVYNPMKQVLANDIVDGNLTSKVNVTNNVNTTKAGIYTTHYVVKNSRGQEMKAVQVVLVNDGHYAYDNGYILSAQDFSLKDSELKESDAYYLSKAKVSVYHVETTSWIDEPTIVVDRSKVSSKAGTYPVTFKFNPQLTVNLRVEPTSSNLPDTGQESILIIGMMCMLFGFMMIKRNKQEG